MKKYIIPILLFACITGKCQLSSFLGNSSSYSGTVYLHDDFSGSSINAAKWTVTNPDPTKVTFVQDGKISNGGQVLKMMVTGVGTTSFMADNIASVATFTSGQVKFAIDMNFPIGVSPIICPIYVDNNNRVCLTRDLTNWKWDFVIVQGGTTRYTATGIADLNAIIKIKLDASNNISCWVWGGASWVQKGTTQTYNLGTNKKFLMTYTGGANVRSLITIDDVWMTSLDYTTVDPNPSSLPNKWVDLAQCGAIGDSVTDNVTCINTALVNADTILLQNGKFKIGSSILIPSNKTVYIHNATIIQNAGTYDNIFRNKDSTGNSNIKIISLGNTTLSQNCKNNNDGTGRTTYGTSGWRSWHYLSGFFLNVTNFELSGIFLKDYEAWCLLIQRSRNGNIHDCSVAYKTGIANQDGIDIGHGSRKITFKNIELNTGDDGIALVDFNAGSFVNRSYMGGGTDTITFTNIYATYDGVSFFRILTGDGGYIRHITGSNTTCFSSKYYYMLFWARLLSDNSTKCRRFSQYFI